MTSTPQATHPPARPSSRWRDLVTLPARTTLLIVLGVLAYVTVAGPGAGLLTRLVASSPAPTALVPIATLLLGEALLGGLLLLLVATRGWWRQSSLVPDRPLRPMVREWRSALVLPLGLLAVMVGRVAVGLSSGPARTLLAHTAPATIVVLLVSAMLLVGFNEELLFRGLALGALLRDRGTTRREVYQAVITVSVLFGLAHLIRQGPITTKLELAAGTAAMGLAFAGVRLATGSIWTGVLLHGLGNSIQLVGALSLGFFASSITHGPPLWLLAIMLPLAILAGISGIERYLLQHAPEQRNDQPLTARPTT